EHDPRQGGGVQPDVVHQAEGDDAGGGEGGERAGVGPGDDNDGRQQEGDAVFGGHRHGDGGDEGGGGDVARPHRRQEKGDDEQEHGNQHGAALDERHDLLHQRGQRAVGLGHAEHEANADQQEEQLRRKAGQH